MVKIIRHQKLYSREMIRTKIPLIRFLCEKCDCVFEVNRADLKINNVTGCKEGKPVYFVEATCPDCHRPVTRHCED